MMKNNAGLVLYAKAQVGKPYWFGTFGQTASSGLLRSKRSQYPSYYRDKDFDKQIGQRVHDCIGLIKGYIWSDSSTSAPKYNASQDCSAAGMYDRSKTRGNMSTFPAINGTLVYKKSGSKIHHVGIYCVDGFVYEAKGHRYGVVKTPYRQSDWQLWSLCPYIEYCEHVNSNDANKKSNETIAREVLQGMWGNGTDRKERLTKAGYDYTAIQKIVNSISTGKKSNETIAREVIQGKWGNGADRKNRLASAGYDYKEIQRIVNRLL